MMKKSNKKKPTTKKASPRKAPNSAKKAPAMATNSKRHVVTQQPQSKTQAAVSSGMFLYTDDAWSLRYFDPKDLHCKERDIFG